MTNDNTITVPEAAQSSRVIVTYLYQLLASGRLKGEKRDGRWLIDKADFERWNRAHKFYRRSNKQ